MALVTKTTGRIATLVAAGALSAGLLAACSSSSGGSTGSSNNSPSPAAFNEATATTTITTNWQNFFDSNKPVADKPALLENGTQLTAVITALEASPTAKGTTAKVKKVVIDPTHQKATITYDILGAGGSVQLPNATGVAVYQNGQWLVSKASFCGLVALGAQATGATPPADCAGS
jgi:hypothetical protein